MRARTASRNGSVTVPAAMRASVGRSDGTARVGCPEMTDASRRPGRLPLALAAFLVASVAALAPTSTPTTRAATADRATTAGRAIPTAAPPATNLIGLTGAIVPGT